MRQARLHLLLFLLSIAVIMAAPKPMRAQGLFGSITGVVTDATGAVVPNATVKVTNINTGVVTALRTNNEGVYTASSLNPGTYRVQAEAQGFKTAVANDIAVAVNASTRVTLA